MKRLECEMLDVQHNGPTADSSRSYLIHKKHICVSLQEANIASFCLRYLTFDCFNKNLAEGETQDFLLKGYYAFGDYAVAHWIDHLTATGPGALQKGVSDAYNLSECVRPFLQRHAPRSGGRVEGLDSKVAVAGLQTAFRTRQHLRLRDSSSSMLGAVHNV